MSSTSTKDVVSRVPEITVYFWILKFFTTAMGESTSDFLVFHMNPYFAVALGGIAFTGALVLKLRIGKYTAVSYWFTALMVAIFGTMAADVVHVAIGVPYIDSTLMFAAILAGIFILWYAGEETLSIHSINSFRRELYYWAVVFTTFALGTAAGDLTASTFGLGYLSSGFLFAVLIAIVGSIHWIDRNVRGMDNPHLARNAVVAYWTAYILTRPFGASIADWLDKPHSIGGLALGDGMVSIYLFIPILFFVWLVASRQGHSAVQPPEEDNPGELYQAK